MSITLFGIIYLCVLLVAFFLKYKWLAYIYAFSYLFQSSAVFGISGTGMAPYMIAPFALWVKGLFLPSTNTAYSFNLKKIFAVFFIFVVFQGCFSTMLFDGMRVYQVGGLETNLGSAGVPLHFGIRNIYQWYCLGINLLGLYSLYTHRGKIPNNYASHVIIISSIIVVALGLWRYITVNFGGWFPVDFIYSDYFAIDNVEQVTAGLVRFTSIFLEASWCGLFLAVWIWNLFWLNTYNKFVLIAIIVLCIILTLSSTGLMLAMIGFMLFSLINKKIKYLILIVFFLLCAYVFLKSTMFGEFVYYSVFEKTDSVSAESRIGIMDYSWNLFIKTYGLGCGLGSSISSNFVLGLLSQIGILGTFLFTLLLWKVAKKIRFNHCRVLLFPGLLLMIGLFGAGGSLTHPILWLEIILMLSINEDEIVIKK